MPGEIRPHQRASSTKIIIPHSQHAADVLLLQSLLCSHVRQQDLKGQGPASREALRGAFLPTLHPAHAPTGPRTHPPIPPCAPSIISWRGGGGRGGVSRGRVSAAPRCNRLHHNCHRNCRRNNCRRNRRRLHRWAGAGPWRRSCFSLRTARVRAPQWAGAWRGRRSRSWEPTTAGARRGCGSSGRGGCPTARRCAARARAADDSSPSSPRASTTAAAAASWSVAPAQGGHLELPLLGYGSGELVRVCVGRAWQLVRGGGGLRGRAEGGGRRQRRGSQQSPGPGACPRDWAGPWRRSCCSLRSARARVPQWARAPQWAGAWRAGARARGSRRQRAQGVAAAQAAAVDARRRGAALQEPALTTTVIRPRRAQALLPQLRLRGPWPLRGRPPRAAAARLRQWRARARVCGPCVAAGAGGWRPTGTRRGWRQKAATGVSVR